MSTKTILHVNAFAHRVIAIAVLALNIQKAKAVLTEGTTVTADSIYLSGSAAWVDCLWGLVDGKF